MTFPLVNSYDSALAMDVSKLFITKQYFIGKIKDDEISFANKIRSMLYRANGLDPTR